MPKRLQVYYTSTKRNEKEYIFISCLNIKDAHRIVEDILNERIIISEIIEL